MIRRTEYDVITYANSFKQFSEPLLIKALFHTVIVINIQYEISKFLKTFYRMNYSSKYTTSFSNRITFLQIQLSSMIILRNKRDSNNNRKWFGF